MEKRRSIECRAAGEAIRGETFRSTLTAALVAALLSCTSPAVAQRSHVRIGDLADVPFGTIGNFSTDAVQTQDVCVYSNSSTQGYNVTASGDGSGGAFVLSSGSHSLDYEVQWNSSPGQSSGLQLVPGVPLTGQTSSATQQFCNSGPPSSASLIVLIRSSVAVGATAGTYSGALTLIIGVE